MGEEQGLVGFLQNVDIKKVSEETEFKIGDVTFFMKRMPALSAWKILDKLREKVLGNVAIGNIQALLNMSSDFVEEHLLQHVLHYTRFMTPDVKKGKLLLEEYPDKALNPEYGVEPTDIYQLIGRFLCINFPTLLQQIGKQIGKQDI